MLRILEDLSADWRRLNARIEDLSSEIEALARQDKGCERLMSVPGIGPLIASAMVAAIGNGTAFAKGRDFAAWLGLVPKQMSAGDRDPRCISKRGNRYLRTLFMQGARVILSGQQPGQRFGSWLTAAANRLHHNVLATALPISWRGSPDRWRRHAATKHARQLTRREDTRRGLRVGLRNPNHANAGYSMTLPS
jgi:transposase